MTHDGGGLAAVLPAPFTAFPCVCWEVLSIDTNQSHLVRETPTEEFPPSDWLAGVSVRNLLNF